MPNSFAALQKELAVLVDRHTFREGMHCTDIANLVFFRHSIPYRSNRSAPPYKIDKPSIFIMVQGVKDVLFGEERFSYGPPHYLVASMDLPIVAEVLEASAAVPNLSCKIEFSRSDILELLSDDAQTGSHRGQSSRSLNVAEMDRAMLDAVVRLIGLLDTPADIPALAPLFTKEIVYRVLHGEHGRSLRQIVTDGTPAMHIQHAIQHLLYHFQEPLRVSDLADIAKMSVPSFHRHFKQITAMSPIQFQKQLRLQEARQLLITEDAINVADTAFRVGYESPTQFIREYSRMFGVSPKKDRRRIKETDEHGIEL
ncbi:AraC family transcriptional regulator [Paenibacillus sp. 598K]|uniref:AraC family transcriptional regulator n=1 Tax=Paenibacillus sp. 598K TaxID=1117987 RepID=UPI000FF9EE29|nr:AraC family transcriptional regulator [Paenibacillus sp. 598K]GBF74419.1 AraC family transcriptional regulator [Paenibacillus sp. 598K]